MTIAQSIVDILLILLLLAFSVAAATIPAQIEFTKHAMEERAEGLTRVEVFQQMPKSKCEKFNVWVCTPTDKLTNIVAACKLEGRDTWIKAVLGFVYSNSKLSNDFLLITAYPSNSKSLFRSLKRDNCTEADAKLVESILKEIFK